MRKYIRRSSANELAHVLLLLFWYNFFLSTNLSWFGSQLFQPLMIVVAGIKSWYLLLSSAPVIPIEENVKK
jgi:hypothetical protein